MEPFAPDGLARLTSIEGYAAAEPFPDLVIDDLFDPRALDQVLSEWPEVGAPEIDSYHDGTYTTLKYASNFRTKYEPHTRFVLTRLGEPMFLEAWKR